ncbi:MAG: hypothetical protein JWR80_2037 [Bradyrhizobium sp.]|nr:hypothetical protein [Bradyrhizobium sp.]
MDREPNDAIALIDLGAASVETQGEGKEIFDLVSLQNQAGLSND